MKMTSSKNPTDTHCRNKGDFSDSCQTPNHGNKVVQPHEAQTKALGMREASEALTESLRYTQDL